MPLFGKPDVKKLAEKGDVNGLVKALKDDATRQAAGDALVKLGAPAVDPLIQILKKDGFNHTIVDILGQIGDRRAVEPLVALLEQGKPPINDQPYVADALGRIGDYRAVPAMIQALKRLEYKICFLKFTDPEELTVDIIVNSTHLMGYWWIAHRLARFVESAVDPLIEVLLGEDDTPKYGAMAALAEISEPTVGRLAAAIKSRPGYKKEELAGVLERAGEKLFVKGIEGLRWREWAVTDRLSGETVQDPSFGAQPFDRGRQLIGPLIYARELMQSIHPLFLALMAAAKHPNEKPRAALQRLIDTMDWG